MDERMMEEEEEEQEAQETDDEKGFSVAAGMDMWRGGIGRTHISCCGSRQGGVSPVNRVCAYRTRTCPFVIQCSSNTVSIASHTRHGKSPFNRQLRLKADRRFIKTPRKSSWAPASFFPQGTSARLKKLRWGRIPLHLSVPISLPGSGNPCNTAMRQHYGVDRMNKAKPSKKKRDGMPE